MEIITAKHIAARDHCRSVREWVSRRSAEFLRRRGLYTPFTGIVRIDETIHAQVNFGRWIAVCPTCRGAEYVDPDEPMFYCLSCGNARIGGDALTVIFPGRVEHAQIEAALTEREIELTGSNQIEAALARPINPNLPRNWQPGETAADLHAANVSHNPPAPIHEPVAPPE